jgi:hypothetical protein
MKFNVLGAKEAGYSDEEIRKFLLSTPETAEAKKAGYSDEEIFQHFGLAAPESTAMRTAKVAAGGAAGPLAGLAAGGLAGAVTGGLAAAAPAAAIGAGLLGGAELVGNVYNLGRSALGYDPVKTPYQYIRGATEAAFPSVAPQTPYENVVRAASEGGLGAVTGAAGAGQIANVLSQAGRAAPAALRALAAQPVSQGIAGAAGAAVPEALAQSGETNPYVLGAAGLAAGYGAGRFGVSALEPRPTVGAQAEAKRGRMQVREETAFRRAYNTGGMYDNANFNNFLINTEADLRNAGYANDPEMRGVTRALDQLSDAGRSNVLDVQEIHRLRKRIGDTLTSKDPNVQRLGYMLRDSFDNFISDPSNARAGREAQTERAVGYLNRAITTSSRLFRNDEIREAVRLASVSKRDQLGALSNEFGKIFRDPDKIARFSPNEQEIIADLAAGRASPRAVQLLGALAPSADWSGIAKGVVEFGPAIMASGAIPGAAVFSPVASLGLAGVGAGSIMARRAQNAMAGQAAQNLMASTLGGVPTLPLDYRNLAPAFAAGSQSLNAMAK